MKKGILLLGLLVALVFSAGCAKVIPVQAGSHPSGATADRFAKARFADEFVEVNKSVDCAGTTVTIEKILFDLTHTFMLASVNGPIQGKMDSLCVDLFDENGVGLGRSTFRHRLPDGKTLLTFRPVAAAPRALILEFFGGPVGYGKAKPVLEIKDVPFNTVKKSLVREYNLKLGAGRADGYQLTVDKFQAGLSECMVHYKLTALGDYDGVVHGWLYDWRNNYSPEGEIITLTSGEKKLAPHLSTINCAGPYYRISQDRKNVQGRAYFDPPEEPVLAMRLTNIFCYYRLNELIPIAGVTERLEINKQISVKGYTIVLNSFAQDPLDGKTWTLDYSVLDAAGRKTDAAIDAGIYMKGDNYRMNLTVFRRFKDPAAKDYRLVFHWEPPASEHSLAEGPAIKITRLGIRQEDALVTIDLKNYRDREDKGAREEKEAFRAVQEYYDLFAKAVVKNDVSILETRYGYLRPTGKRDGINRFREKFSRPVYRNATRALRYEVSYDEPIVTLKENTAIVDVHGIEKYVWGEGRGEFSGGEYSAVFYLEKTAGKWRITMIDELLEEECREFRC